LQKQSSDVSACSTGKDVVVVLVAIAGRAGVVINVSVGRDDVGSCV